MIQQLKYLIGKVEID